ncbi:MAG TPA: DUF3006 domain-containing protein [Candidatus Wallbacteria bacterium]|nr:DUF3006 domain-containing protein [Candidatus Wallbacteria bacterium]
MPSKTEFTAIIDRIEGELAVLEMQLGHQLVIPTIYLPREIHDGAVLKIDFKYDPEATRKKRADAEKLQNEVHSTHEPDVI